MRLSLVLIVCTILVARGGDQGSIPKLAMRVVTKDQLLHSLYKQGGAAAQREMLLEVTDIVRQVCILTGNPDPDLDWDHGTMHLWWMTVSRIWFERYDSGADDELAYSYLRFKLLPATFGNILAREEVEGEWLWEPMWAGAEKKAVLSVSDFLRVFSIRMQHTKYEDVLTQMATQRLAKLLRVDVDDGVDQYEGNLRTSGFIIASKDWDGGRGSAISRLLFEIPGGGQGASRSGAGDDVDDGEDGEDGEDDLPLISEEARQYLLRRLGAFSEHVSRTVGDDSTPWATRADEIFDSFVQPLEPKAEGFIIARRGERGPAWGRPDRRNQMGTPSPLRTNRKRKRDCRSPSTLLRRSSSACFARWVSCACSYSVSSRAAPRGNISQRRTGGG